MEKVPWAKKVRSRPCEEFPSWLVRGNFQEDDDCDWAEAARKEKLLEKWRRRGELEQVLGRDQPGPAPVSPSWSEEEEEEEDEEDEEEDEEGWRSPQRGEREELGGLESDSSGQSLVTHIRTPPRVTVLEEEEEEELEEIPRPHPSIRWLDLKLRRDGEGEPGPVVELSSLVRSHSKRLKLC